MQILHLIMQLFIFVEICTKRENDMMCVINKYQIM